MSWVYVVQEVVKALAFLICIVKFTVVLLYKQKKK